MTLFPDRFGRMAKTSSFNQMIFRMHSICFLFKDLRIKSWRDHIIVAQDHGLRAEISQFTPLRVLLRCSWASCLKLHRKLHVYHVTNKKGGLTDSLVLRPIRKKVQILDYGQTTCEVIVSEGRDAVASWLVRSYPCDIYISQSHHLSTWSSTSLSIWKL